MFFRLSTYPFGVRDGKQDIINQSLPVPLRVVRSRKDNRRRGRGGWGHGPTARIYSFLLSSTLIRGVISRTAHAEAADFFGAILLHYG
jgi:hypothetical protein